MSAVRSALYVPGDRADMLARGASRGADALIVDLEDAVALSAKESARRTARAFLEAQPDAGGAETEIWVRVNPGRRGLEDIAAVASAAVTGFVLAKAERGQDVRAAAYAAEEAEQTLGLRVGSLVLSPLLESAAAILDARFIAGASPRVRRLQIGEADLCADLGVSLGEDERELLLVRSAVVLASAAIGIDAPLAAVSTDFKDLGRFRASTEAFRRLGFHGRACIHPAQCGVANEVFTPAAEELERARRLVARYESPGTAAVFTDDDGRMIDLAVIREARRLIASSERVALRPTQRISQ